MKTLLPALAAFILLCISESIKGQDTLMFRNGNELIAKIEKISTSEILYRTQPDSTLKTIEKAEVFMVKFKNGTKYVVEAPSLLNTAPASLNERKLAEEYNNYRYLYESRKVKGIALLSIGGAFMVTGLPLLVHGSVKQRQANIDANIKYQQTGLTPVVDNTAVRMIVPGAVFTAASIPLTIVGATYLGTMPRYKRMMNEAKALISFAPSLQPIIPAGNIYGTQTGLAMLVTF